MEAAVTRKQFTVRHLLLPSMLLTFTVCNSIADQVTIPPTPEDDVQPEITVTAIPIEPTSAGDIEKSKAKSTVVSNVDSGMSAQLIVTAVNGVAPKTTGGVQSLSVSISQNGTTVFQGNATGVMDSSGKVPNLLGVFKTSSNAAITVQMTSTVVLSATASNFHGQSNTLAVTYVPIDPNERKKDIREHLILSKVSGQNLYIATVPDASALPASGFLRALNGGPLAAPTILKRQNTSACLDPAETIELTAFANLNTGDLTKLFGSETPEFSFNPINIIACANPAAPPLPDQLEIRATYQLR
jgi:hypothetical protein